MEKASNTFVLARAMRAFFSDSRDLMYIKDENLIYREASPAFAKWTGLCSPDEVVGRTDFDLFQDASLARHYRENDLRALRTGAPVLGLIEPVPPCGGKDRYVSASKYPVFGLQGEALGVLGTARLVDDGCRVWPEDAETMVRLMGTTLCAGFICTYPRAGGGLVCCIGDELLGRLGYDRATFEELYGDDFVKAIYSEDTADVLRDMRRLVDERTEGTISFRMCGKEGRLRRLLAAFRPVRLCDDVDALMGVLADLADIEEERRLAERRAREQKLHYERIAREHAERLRMAHMDALTGVCNREGTMRAIEEYLAGEGEGETSALLMIDVDGFKSVNDTFGHQMGDRMLKRMATAIAGCFRDTDIVGRVGGDEFFVLMKRLGDRSVVARKASELLEAMEFLCETESARVPLSGSVGVSLYEGPGKDLPRLYEEADTALYRAKTRGKNCFVFADECLAATPDVPEAISCETPNAVSLCALMENLPGVAVLLAVGTGDVRVLYASRSLFRVFKRDAREVGRRGEWIERLVFGEDLPALRSEIFSAVSEGRSPEAYFRVRAVGAAPLAWRRLQGVWVSGDCDGDKRLLCLITDCAGQ